jgi:hypothetical protein
MLTQQRNNHGAYGRFENTAFDPNKGDVFKQNEI